MIALPSGLYSSSCVGCYWFSPATTLTCSCSSGMNAQGEITGVISSYLNIQDCVGANITNINGYLGCSGMRTTVICYKVVDARNAWDNRHGVVLCGVVKGVRRESMIRIMWGTCIVHSHLYQWRGLACECLSCIHSIFHLKIGCCGSSIAINNIVCVQCIGIIIMQR